MRRGDMIYAYSAQAQRGAGAARARECRVTAMLVEYANIAYIYANQAALNRRFLRCHAYAGPSSVVRSCWLLSAQQRVIRKPRRCGALVNG